MQRIYKMVHIESVIIFGRDVLSIINSTERSVKIIYKYWIIFLPSAEGRNKIWWLLLLLYNILRDLGTCVSLVQNVPSLPFCCFIVLMLLEIELHQKRKFFKHGNWSLGWFWYTTNMVLSQNMSIFK